MKKIELLHYIKINSRMNRRSCIHQRDIYDVKVIIKKKIDSIKYQNTTNIQNIC